MRKNCPFCNSDKHELIKTHLTSTESNINIKCNDCGARGPGGFGKNTAEQFWNRRAPLSPQESPQQWQLQQKPHKCPLCEEGIMMVYPDSMADMAHFIALGYEYRNEKLATKDCRACEKGVLWK